MNGFDRHLFGTTFGTLLFAAMTLLTGCSSSDGTASGGIEGTGDKVAAPISASGSVTGFGSIWVNGIRFDVSSAVVTRDDETLSEQVIQPGMIVQVDGTVDTDGVAHAKTVKLDDVLRGPITAIVKSGNPYSEIQVLGQTVIIPEEVVVNGLTTATLKVGDNIIVNGLKGADGSTLATRLELADPTDSVHIEGAIVSLDADQYHLVIGASQVDYSNARFVDGNATQLAVGKELKVEAVTPVAPSSSPVLSATVIRFKSARLRDASGSHLFQEGVITTFTSTASFSLNGLTVDATQSMISRGSLTSLATGVRITVEGTINSEGVLVAKNINVLLPSETRYSGTIEAIDLLARQITVLGTKFTIDSHTAYEDLSSRENRKINLSNFSIGDTVEVFGRKVGSDWFANRIRRLDPNNGLSSLRGPVGEILPNSQFYVMGVLVDASNAIGKELLESLTVGQLLMIQGTLTGDHAMKATRIATFVHDHCPSQVANTCEHDGGEESKSVDIDRGGHRGR